MATDAIFISHATEDDAFVADLRMALENYGLPVWVDSRNLRGGDQLAPEIRQAIETARYVLVVFSPKTINSAWVPQEIEHALNLKKKVIPLLLEGIKPTALRLWFKEEPLAVPPIKIDPGGLAEAMPAIMAALGERLPTDPQLQTIIAETPLDELTLELSDPKIEAKDGTRRATATGRLIYKSSHGYEPAESVWYQFVSPLGAIEKNELRWYLEEYFKWPVGVFRTRAQDVERKLAAWGQALYQTAIPVDREVQDVLTPWKQTETNRERRFTVKVDPRAKKGSSEQEEAETQEAATLLLGLPWELLHDGKTYLFQGGQGVRVRRGLPRSTAYPTFSTKPPIRILLVSPRPEDESAGYIDHRISAKPLVATLEPLGDLAELTVLAPPTFPVLEQELLRAKEARKPYHVVHFDGHGVYDKKVGLGHLCFEHPEDTGKLEKRRSQLISADQLAQTLAGHRIPLFFLEACQTAQAEVEPGNSVAAALLDQGVASVVAMSHSVLVETARRFVAAFYTALVTGKRVGEAMLSGQRELKTNSWRGKIMGAGDLELQDWFVPVLFQETRDPYLITKIPSAKAQELQAKQRKLSLGELPESPAHKFIGRSRELLTIERLLCRAQTGVQTSVCTVCLLGEGGEGKTALAVEAARWLVATRRFRRAVFASVEDHSDARTLLDKIGRQLVPKYSVAQFKLTPSPLSFAGTKERGDESVVWLKEALQPVERALDDRPTILVIDNLESILPLPTPNPSQEGNKTSPPLWGGVGGEVLPGVLALCRKLLEIPGTAILFASHELLTPFALSLSKGEFEGFSSNKVSIGRLLQNEAIELVSSVLARLGLQPKKDDPGCTPAEIEALVEAVNGHARSLVLLAPEVSRLDVQATTTNLGRLMAELHRHYPNDRERSLFASVELSLRRLSPETRQKIKVLGVFQGGANLAALGTMLQMQPEEIATLARELIAAGLAENMGYGHLRLDPALCPYLWQELAEHECAQVQAAWAAGMVSLTNFLYEQAFKDAQLASSLTLLEFPNLLAALAYLQQTAEAEQVVDFATNLETLLQNLGRPRALAQVVAVCTAAAQQLGAWSHVRFKAEQSAIERLLENGQLQSALTAAQELLQRCSAAGIDAYRGADYDLAMAYFLLGRVLQTGSRSEDALQSLMEAQRRFQSIADLGNRMAAVAASGAITEIGDCLCGLGHWDAAASAYQESIQRFEHIGDFRWAAVNKLQLGTVRVSQKRYVDALQVYQSARNSFERLGEPGSVAGAWHQIGIVYRETGNFDAAEAAYRKGLAIFVQLKNHQRQADSLGELGNLYNRMRRLEDAVAFYRQAADIHIQTGDLAKEGFNHNNIANTLIKLRRFDEARTEVRRAIECKRPFGHAAEPWKTWMILYNLEQATGNPVSASRAREQAIQTYEAYRRAGGESHSTVAQLCALTAQSIQNRSMAEVETKLANYLKQNIPLSGRAALAALQAILAGSRDPALTAGPALEYADVVELRLLLEGLRTAQG
jgi:tetratricopeptide (TPR) repeat protein